MKVGFLIGLGIVILLVAWQVSRRLPPLAG